MTEPPGVWGLWAWQLTGTGAGSLVLPAPPHQNNENPLGPFCSACAPTSNPKLQPWKRVCEDRRGPARLLWSIQEGEQGLAWMFSPAENRALGCGEIQGFGAGQGAPKMEVEPRLGMCTPGKEDVGLPPRGTGLGLSHLHGEQLQSESGAEPAADGDSWSLCPAGMCVSGVCDDWPTAARFPTQPVPRSAWFPSPCPESRVAGS